MGAEPCQDSHDYQAPMEGACRGPGGKDDKVESKYVHERSADACRQDCDNEIRCAGYAYHPAANGGECLVFGPGMAGSCSDSSAISPDQCAALGSCSDSTKTSEDECGTCS